MSTNPSITSSMLSGIELDLDKRDIERIEGEVQKYNSSYGLIEVKTVTLNRILKEKNISYIDLLSLDIEGAELEVLKSIDFNTYFIKAITVENNYDNKELKHYLEKQGFTFVTHVGVDDIYIHS